MSHRTAIERPLLLITRRKHYERFRAHLPAPASEDIGSGFVFATYGPKPD